MYTLLFTEGINERDGRAIFSNPFSPAQCPIVALAIHLVEHQAADMANPYVSDLFFGRKTTSKDTEGVNAITERARDGMRRVMKKVYPITHTLTDNLRKEVTIDQYASKVGSHSIRKGGSTFITTHTNIGIGKKN